MKQSPATGQPLRLKLRQGLAGICGSPRLLFHGQRRLPSRTPLCVARILLLQAIFQLYVSNDTYFVVAICFASACTEFLVEQIGYLALSRDNASCGCFPYRRATEDFDGPAYRSTSERTGSFESARRVVHHKEGLSPSLDLPLKSRLSNRASATEM